MLITDGDILAAAEQLARQQDLDAGQQDAAVLAMQRLVWPPSPWPFLHEGEHVVLEIGRHDGGGWYGELLCLHGCARAWRVRLAANQAAVHGALAAAHQEYRTGRITASAAPPHGRRRVSLDSLLSRAEYVEVTDRHLTPEETHA